MPVALRALFPAHLSMQVGDVLVTFAASIEVPAVIRFLHPVHNFVIIQYDAASIAGTPVKSARLAAEPPLV